MEVSAIETLRLRTRVRRFIVGNTPHRARLYIRLFGCHVRSTLPWPWVAAVERPVFVIGSARSGTSLLTRLLDGTPDLHAFSEHPIVRHNLWGMMERPNLPRQMRRLEKMLARLSGVGPGQRIVEKSPGHSLVATELARRFPDAQFIHILRDGRAVATSMLSHAWIEAELREVHPVFWFWLLPAAYQVRWPSLSVWERGVLRWAVFVTGARKISGLTGRYFEIRYERLCRAPAAATSDILTFLALEATPHAHAQLDEIHADSVERWRDCLSDREQAFYREVLKSFNLEMPEP